MPRDYVAAAAWFERAADAGDAGGAGRSRQALRGRASAPRSTTQRAAELYRLAADQGDMYGQNNLGFLMDNGLGMAADPAGAANTTSSRRTRAWRSPSTTSRCSTRRAAASSRTTRRRSTLYREAAEAGEIGAAVNLGRHVPRWRRHRRRLCRGAQMDRSSRRDNSQPDRAEQSRPPLREWAWASTQTATWRVAATTSSRPTRAISSRLDNLAAARCGRDYAAAAGRRAEDPAVRKDRERLTAIRGRSCRARRAAITVADAAMRCAVEKNSRWMRKSDRHDADDDREPVRGEPGHRGDREIVGAEPLLKLRAASELSWAMASISSSLAMARMVDGAQHDAEVVELAQRQGEGEEGQDEDRQHDDEVDLHLGDGVGARRATARRAMPAAPELAEDGEDREDQQHRGRGEEAHRLHEVAREDRVERALAPRGVGDPAAALDAHDHRERGPRRSMSRTPQP